jgi:hypothetical protein
LYILENLQIQVAPGATCKTCPSSTGTLGDDSVTSNHILKNRKKNGKEVVKEKTQYSGNLLLEKFRRKSVRRARI